MALRGYSRGWLASAMAVSAALILGAPYVGQLRTVIRSSIGDRFPAFMLAVVVGAAGMALVYALVRIRTARAARYGALSAAVAVAIGYAMATATGIADVDAVERFHFVEYGLVTALFYRAWRPAGDSAVLVMPVLAGLLVGTLEEWFQWFIPARVGEVRDVLLNLDHHDVDVALGVEIHVADDRRAGAAEVGGPDDLAAVGAQFGEEAVLIAIGAVGAVVAGKLRLDRAGGRGEPWAGAPRQVDEAVAIDADRVDAIVVGAAQQG